MAVLFEKTKLLTDKQFHYCPGCNHGIIHRLVAEVIDEMNLDGKVVGVAPVGCSVFAYDYFNCDMYEAAHGPGSGVHPAAEIFVAQHRQGVGQNGHLVAVLLDILGVAVAHQGPAVDIPHTGHIGEKVVHYSSSPHRISPSVPVMRTGSTRL